MMAKTTIPTISELVDLIGTTGEIFVGGFKVRVVIKSAKFSYGHLRYQVEPVTGSGSIWTEQKPK